MASEACLIVAANEQVARFFLRREREAPLLELEELAESADLLDLHGRRFDRLRRFAGRTMVKTQSQRAEEELQLFLQRVAEQIDRAVGDFGCRALAVFAPPRVLAMLRGLVRAETRALIRLEVCEDKTGATASQLEAPVQAPDM